MPNWTIQNGANTPLNVDTGTVPDGGGALRDWFQPMVFVKVAKSVGAYQDVEVDTEINFQGVIQPFKERALLFKPEGQRAWTWFVLYSDPVLNLHPDEIVTYLGIDTRIMAKKDFSIYGYNYYEIVQDWNG